MEALYQLENTVLRQLGKDIEENERFEVQFNQPEALTEQFKAMLLSLLARRTKENLRIGRILTVSHPDMGVDEQVPFLAERWEVPAITVRRFTPEDREQMYALRTTFPQLLDTHNALGSSFNHTPDSPYLLAC